MSEIVPAAQQFMSNALSSVVRRSPVSCAPDTPIRTVLETMRAQAIGSMIVVGPDLEPLGILTLRDALDRVTLQGHDLAGPIASVMSTGLFMLAPQASAYDAAIAMAARGVDHVVLVEHGRLVAVVSERDLFGRLPVSLRQVSRGIRETRDDDGMLRASAGIHSLARSMLAQGAGAAQVTQLISMLNDSLTQQIISLAMAPDALCSGEYCWIVMGSEGRFEQTLSSDQDNGIIFRCGDRSADDVRELLMPAARRINQSLAAVGFPLCRGGIMAGNPECCLSLAEWERRFADWIDRGDPKALLNASIFFDFRAMHGARQLAAELREWLTSYAQGNSRFLLQMTQNALENQPPLGLLRDFVLTRAGDFPHTLDLKVNGVTPFVDAARIYALRGGIANTGTVERLRLAFDAQGSPQAMVEAWIEAFFAIQMLRLRHQDGLGRRDQPLHNQIDPDRLNEFERRMLKESMRQAKQLQARLARDHSLAFPGFGA